MVVAAFLYFSWQAVSIHPYGFRDDGRSADCAIVLGTAAWHNKPSPVFEERLNHAIKLYEDGRVKALVLTGGFGTNAPKSESQVAKTYLPRPRDPGGGPPPRNQVADHRREPRGSQEAPRRAWA